MTRQPWTVQVDDSLSVARRMMAEREIHHLPVLAAGEVVGLVTDRDLALSADRLGTVEDVMSDAHCVSGDTELDEVLEAMTTRRRDAVVITDEGAVEGIFTASDAVRVLREVIHEHQPGA